MATWHAEYQPLPRHKLFNVHCCMPPTIYRVLHYTVCPTMSDSQLLTSACRWNRVSQVRPASNLALYMRLCAFSNTRMCLGSSGHSTQFRTSPFRSCVRGIVPRVYEGAGHLVAWPGLKAVRAHCCKVAKQRSAPSSKLE